MASRTFYGITNCAAFNVRPEGDTSWYETREERDAALVTIREGAVSRGLSKSASVSGIYPVKREVRGDVQIERFVEEHCGEFGTST